MRVPILQEFLFKTCYKLGIKVPLFVWDNSGRNMTSLQGPDRRFLYPYSGPPKPSMDEIR